jgi:Tfp pilus assembly protein PilX
MKDSPRPALQRQGERGIALVAVLLLLMMMSALGMALAVNGETETLIARNQIAGMQAQAAAEAGLNHAVEVATEYIFDWKSNGFASSDLAVDERGRRKPQRSCDQYSARDRGRLQRHLSGKHSGR